MAKKPLNAQMKLFAREYFACNFNGRQAAVNAKYSAATAKQTASRLLKDPRIRELNSEIINEALGTQRDQLRYKVIKKWNKIAFADRCDDIKIVKKKVMVTELVDGKPTEVEKEFQVVEISDTVDAKNSDIISSIKQTKDGIEIKYQDADKALEQLGKYGGLLTEKIELETNTDQIVFYLPTNGRDENPE